MSTIELRASDWRKGGGMVPTRIVILVNTKTLEHVVYLQALHEGNTLGYLSGFYTHDPESAWANYEERAADNDRNAAADLIGWIRRSNGICA